MRLNLRNWIKLSQIRRKIKEDKDNANIADLLIEALSLSPEKSSDKLKTLSWFQIREAFFSLLLDNQIRIPFFILLEGDKENPSQWEYPERDWYSYLHTFGSSFGWDADTVSKLDIDDAIGLIQEIEIENQLEKEWQHSLTEIAYVYDKGSKKSKYVPLKRPKWMNRSLKIKKAPLRKIPKNWIPPGLVIHVNPDEEQNKDT